jgi:putative Holliday junction resolvase
MRLMGIDYGTKRVGVAFTDDKGLMAFPYDTLKNDAELLSHLVRLIEEKTVDGVVIGFSLDREGKPNKVHARVEELIGDLTLHVGVPVHLEPEQYSTQEAIRFQGRNDKTDASAATIILNSYILRNK